MSPTSDRLELDLLDAVDLPERRGPLEAGPRVVIIELGSGDVVTWQQQGRLLLRGTAAAPGHGPGHGSGGGPAHGLTERRMLDDLLLLQVDRRERLADIGLRRRGEGLRRRTVLLRNVGRGDPDAAGGPTR